MLGESNRVLTRNPALKRAVIALEGPVDFKDDIQLVRPVYETTPSYLCAGSVHVDAVLAGWPK